MTPALTGPVKQGRPAMFPLSAVALAVPLVCLAAILPGWTGFVLACFVMLVGVFRVYPLAGVTFIAATIPLDQSLIIDLPGPAVSVAHLGVWALIVAAAPRLISERAVRFDRMMALWLLVIVALVASIGASTVDIDRWQTAIARWMLPAGVYLLLCSIRLDTEQVRPVLGGVATGVLISSVMATWQLLTVTGPESFIVGGLMRVYGPFNHPNQFAAWLALTLPLLVASLTHARFQLSRSMRIPMTTSIGAGVIALVLTQSRSGLLAFGAAILVVFVVARRRTRLLAACTVGGLLLLAFASGSIASVPGIDRFVDVAVRPGDRVQVTAETWAQEERAAHWGAAWSMLSEHPVTGVGAGGFEASYREHTPAWRFRIPRGHAHNGYIHLGAEAGWAGLVAFTAFVAGGLALLGRQVLASAPGADRALATGALAAMVGFATMSIFEYLRFGAFLAMVALVLSLGFSRRRGGTQGATQ